MTFVKTVAILNALAAPGFSALVAIGTIESELDAGMNFTQFDRQRVINARALGVGPV